MELKFTESKTEWIKFGRVKEFCFIGREYVCLASGCHMLFININSRKEAIYRAIDQETGDGVACIAGLYQSPVVAFAEHKAKAKIFVMTCPEFRRISTMADGSEDGYLNMVFSEAEFLITLTGIPHFSLVVWNWRNGEKIATQETDMLYSHQQLKCCYGSPVYMGQLGVGTNELNVWDILVCGKRCVVTQHAVNSPSEAGTFTSIQWTPEGGLFAVNTQGDLYMMDADYKLELVLKWTEPGDSPTYFVWYKAGFAVAGPNGKIKHYKKSGTWASEKTMQPQETIRRLLSNQRDILIGVTIQTDIILYNYADNTFSSIKPHESEFSGYCMIYPLGEYIITLSRNEEITAWEVRTGKMVDTMRLKDLALDIKENPEFPYIVVSFRSGLIELYSFYESKKITHLASFDLTHNPLSSIRFTEMGRLLVVADMSCGEFFFIEGIPGTKMRVLGTVTAKKQIADYILVASKNCLRLFALQVTSDIYLAGNVITRFCIIKDSASPEVKEYILEDETTFYTKLYATTKPNRDRVFYAVPVESKSIHELATKRGDPLAKVVDRIKTGHHMRKIIYNFDRHHALSFAYDGLAIIRTPNHEYEGMIMPHHRMAAGISDAYIDPQGRYVVSLGRDNSLVCTGLLNIKVSQRKHDEIHEIYESKMVSSMFKYPTGGFLPTGKYWGKTWLEVQELEKIEFERQQCEKERNNILEGVSSIKIQVQGLLTKNITGPENEILDVQEFNLDSQLKEELILESQAECKRTKIYLEALIVAQDKISNWIKEYYWNTMYVQSRSLCGVFGNFEVENYVLLPVDVEQQEILKYIKEHRAIEELMANEEKFTPWIPQTASQLKLHLQITPKLQEIAAPRHEDDDDIDEEKLDMETYTALAGSVTHKFVTVEPGHYHQFEIQTFLQTEYQTILSRVENVKLREYFNKEFESLMSLKVREFSNVVERNGRLRHILSELNYFSEMKVDILVEDPAWEQKENPELILQVADNEVGITPYISPSEQAILDAEAAERERLRLLRLADDFKERALMAMMNGVLEIKWEDELRKDVPLPKCMIEKNPEDFREEDLLAIREYEAAVLFLQSERERYTRMLTAEYGNLGTTLREGVKKFNSRVQDLLVLKIKVDSAIGQENFKINRLRLRNLQRTEMNEREKEAQRAITLNEKKIEEIQKLISSLGENVSECRGHLESVQAKDKVLEKAFRRDFMETSPSCQEVSQKLYKRRPKTNVRGITSVTVLLEVAKSTVTRERVLILSPDALDFLRAMDNLDQYVGVPNAVDESAYALVCKHRRLRIENEIKMKAATLEITEAETTISSLQKVLHQKKELNQTLVNNLAQIRASKLKEAHDIQVQLVVREGLVEIPTCGEIKDFDDAIVISRKDVEDINEVILTAGQKKLKATRDVMHFRRGILAMEWEHKKMKMIINDRLDHITDIRSMKVTKETQSYLKSRARGDDPDKTLTFEQEVDIAKLSYIRIIEERKAAVADLQQKIDVVKKDNKVLDKKIKDVNVDVCEQQLDVDNKVDEREKRVMKLRMASLLRRAKLVKQIQENHNTILMLQTELEILRLKTYPTLKYKIFT